jgi:hypothetical protein
MDYQWKTSTDMSCELEVQYINNHERICGAVSGKNYSGPIREWIALTFPVNRETANLGRFLSLQAGKAAVERFWAKGRRSA